MSKLKHTPGPWEADVTNVFEYSGGKDRLHFRVARCDFDGQRNNEAIANARLIAAAPEMLEALIKIYNNANINGFEYVMVEELIERATGLKIEEVLKCTE